MLDADRLREAMNSAEAAGVKLEIHGELLIWEMMPSPRHVILTKQIEASVRVPAEATNCGCHCYQDMYVRFADGSLKRPDIAIYCEEVAATIEATTLVPGAVIEVVSQESRIKDLELGPDFYLARGVRDVVVLDPDTRRVFHATNTSRQELPSPITLALAMGCEVTV